LLNREIIQFRDGPWGCVCAHIQLTLAKLHRSGFRSTPAI
jgi:hypothetical protein